MDNIFRFDGKVFEPGPDWTGYTTANHLARVRQIKPKEGSDIMTFVGTANSEALSYENYLAMVANVTYDETDDPINRMVFGDGQRNAKLVKIIADDLTRIGHNKAEFTMVFETPFFSDVHIIVGMSDRYKIRLISDARQVAEGWAYRAKAFGPASLFIPASELKAGSYWTKEGAAVPLYDSMKGAKTSYSSPYMITYDWSTVSVEDNVPGNMKHRPVAFGWIDPSTGKKQMTWELHRTWKNDLEFMELKNKTLVWGTSNKNEAGGYDDIDERSGVEIINGAGIVEQSERGNLHYFNEFDIDEFGALLLKMRVGKMATDKTHYVISSGTYGLMKAHESIEAKASGWEKVDNKSIFGDVMNLGFGHRFTRYLHPAGFMLDFRYEPMLDDLYRTPVKHPNGGNARSYEYHLLDIGTTQGDPSFELHYVDSMADNLTIVEGMRSPFSPTGKKVTQRASSVKDAWTERRMSHFMAIIRNPKNCLIYRPNVLR